MATREDGNEREATVIGADTEITYLYLTFETTIPQPNLEASTWTVLPKAPRLVSYTSPLKWSPARKLSMLAMACLATLITAYTICAYSPPVVAMAHDLHSTRLVILVGITSFCVGFGFAPMALAPLSEVWGRYPIFVSAGLVLLVFQAATCVMPNAAGLLICRFFAGTGASVFISVVGGFIADVWEKEDRNTPMAVFSGAVFVGTGGGPLVAAAFMEMEDQTKGWKWTFWHQVIIDGLLLLMLVAFFGESRASVLLSRKARALNKYYDRLDECGVHGAWISRQHLTEASSMSMSEGDAARLEEMDTDKAKQQQPLLLRRVRWVLHHGKEKLSLKTLLSTSLQRPFQMLFTEPVVFWFTIWLSFAWGILYLSFASVPFLYPNDFDRSSRVYTAIAASGVVATVVAIYLERSLSYPRWTGADDGLGGDGRGGQAEQSRFWLFLRRRFPVDVPESRLYFACILAFLMPAGIFGALLAPESWENAPAIGFGFATWGIYSIYLANFNYFADTYHVYSSSAIAAQSLCRQFLGGTFPLAIDSMFKTLGRVRAGALLGTIAAALTVTPWVLVFFGKRIRARSRFAQVGVA